MIKKYKFGGRNVGFTLGVNYDSEGHWANGDAIDYKLFNLSLFMVPATKKEWFGIVFVIGPLSVFLCSNRFEGFQRWVVNKIKPFREASSENRN